MRYPLLIASVALLGLAACSDSTTAKPTTTSAAPDTTAAAPDTTAAGGDDTLVDETFVDDTFVDDTFVDDTFPDATADPTAPGYGTPFCEANDELNNSTSPLDAENPDPAEVEAFFKTTFPEAMAKLIAAAPPDLADDVAVLDTAIKALAALLEQHGWDFNETLQDPAIADIVNNDAFTTASGNVDEYCGTAG